MVIKLRNSFWSCRFHRRRRNVAIDSITRLICISNIHFIFILIKNKINKCPAKKKENRKKRKQNVRIPTVQLTRSHDIYILINDIYTYKKHALKLNIANIVVFCVAVSCGGGRRWAIQFLVILYSFSPWQRLFQPNLDNNWHSLVSRLSQNNETQ